MKELESGTGFYYIGKSQSNIGKLVNIYKRGYASDNLQHAIAELTRENHSPPELICCESHFGLPALKHFAGFLAAHPMLSCIPFVIDGSMMSAENTNLYIRCKVADDILLIQELDESGLCGKIRFLHKFKARALELERQRRTEVSAQVPASMYNFLKRCFDIMIALVAIAFLAPIFMVIAIAVWSESKGPVFYISKRAGRGYRIFNFYKFRTMFDGADRHMAEFAHLNQYQGTREPLFFKINNDPRITRVGRFLRNTSLDELPQLINVLIGDMSLVGNRPLPLYEAETLTTDALAKRFLAPAGITGLWQIKKRGKEEMSGEERISLDIDYANNSNFLYDLWIIANTPQALIQRVNT
jgi:lipopolysaccharide/colanic/teichoic acid biosynthesis glycosyltransferase